MTSHPLPALLLAAIIGLPSAAGAKAAEPLCLQGVNLSGAEFGEGRGTYGKDYIYPSAATVDYFAGKGMNAVRLPFKWERLQPRLRKGFDAQELKRLRAAVALVRGRGMSIVLDPHNYARYNGEVIGSAAVPVAAFADFWQRLAKEFSGDRAVLFGLMNEPYDMPAPQWLDAANGAIAAIRKAGAKNLILVPGTQWTGAHSWRAEIDGGSNAEVMSGVRDPLDRYAFEFHQYLDGDFSGTHGDCPKSAEAAAAIADVSAWLRERGKQGFLGEFGVPASRECREGLAGLMNALEKNRDAWIGWTYWAAGDWWPASEALNIQPTPEGDRPQLATLSEAMARGKGAAGCATQPAGVPGDSKLRLTIP